MEDKKIECQEYTIHLIKTKKFHTIDFSVIFTENVNKRKITFRNTLIDVMSSCTKKYDTTQKLIRKCQELYSIKPMIYNTRIGNLIKTKFGISIINSKYVDKKSIFDNILLLKEIILNPCVDEDGFVKEKVEIAKKQVLNDFETLSENPRVYSNYKSLEILGDGANYNLTNYADRDILETVNSKSLYDDYLEMIQNSRIDIMICGNISNDEEIIKFIKDNFHFNHKNVVLNNPCCYHEICNKEPVKEKEKLSLSQSKLSLVYKLYNASDYENGYVLSVFNSIIGGNGNSLLFKSIREDNSLCYYASSYYNKMDNIIVINSGIDAKNYEKVLALIQEAFVMIQKGEFKVEDMKTAKLDILDNIDGLLDSNQGIIEYEYARGLFNKDDVKTRKQKIKNVSKKDIMGLAGKFSLASVFFLEGDI